MLDRAVGLVAVVEETVELQVVALQAKVTMALLLQAELQVVVVELPLLLQV